MEGTGWFSGFTTGDERCGACGGYGRRYRSPIEQDEYEQQVKFEQEQRSKNLRRFNEEVTAKLAPVLRRILR